MFWGPRMIHRYQWLMNVSIVMPDVYEFLQESEIWLRNQQSTVNKIKISLGSIDWSFQSVIYNFTTWNSDAGSWHRYWLVTIIIWHQCLKYLGQIKAPTHSKRLKLKRAPLVFKSGPFPASFYLFSSFHYSW